MKTLTLEEVREALKAAGKPQTQLARELLAKLGVKEHTVHMVLLGRLKGTRGDARKVAVELGLPRNIDELRLGIADDDAWAQEYELKYLDEASAWLSYDLIASCEDPGAGKPDGYQGGPCFVGRDIGRRNDLHVIWVAELIGDVLWERERIEQKRATFADMDMEFDRVMTGYNVARACIDQTGMGEKVVEDAQRRYGGVIEGVLFTSASKLIMATQGKERFEDRRLRIPEGDVALRTDLHKLRKVSGPTGVPRFVAERDDDHADRTWAIFLGINAAAGMNGGRWRPLTTALGQSAGLIDQNWIPADV